MGFPNPRKKQINATINQTMHFLYLFVRLEWYGEKLIHFDEIGVSVGYWCVPVK